MKVARKIEKTNKIVYQLEMFVMLQNCNKFGFATRTRKEDNISSFFSYWNNNQTNRKYSNLESSTFKRIKSIDMSI